MVMQYFYNVIEQKITYKPFFEAEEHEFQLLDNENHLIRIEKSYGPNFTIYTEITTQSVICWCYNEIQAGIYSIRRYTTKDQDHMSLTTTMPDELHACVLNYLNHGQFNRTVEQVTLHNRLLSHVKKGKKPTRRMKGKYKDVHN